MLSPTTTTALRVSPSPVRSRALKLRAQLSQRLRALRSLRHTEIRHARRLRAQGGALDNPTALAIYHVEAAMAALTRMAHVG